MTKHIFVQELEHTSVQKIAPEGSISCMICKKSIYVDHYFVRLPTHPLSPVSPIGENYKNNKIPNEGSRCVVC